jgi:hypothetical protein
MDFRAGSSLPPPLKEMSPKLLVEPKREQYKAYTECTYYKHKKEMSFMLK